MHTGHTKDEGQLREHTSQVSSRGRSSPVAAAAAAEAGGSQAQSSPEDDGREILVQHLLMKEEQLQELLELQKRIFQEGVDLSDLALEYSVCPSRTNGGMIGWITRGRTVPEFEAAAFGAPLEKLVRVKTKYGWHLLQVLAEREASALRQIEPEEFAQRILDSADEEVQLIDVREPPEISEASLPGFKVFPLSQFGKWAPTIAEDLDTGKDTYVMCHHGVRSQQAAEWLKSQGFKKIYNIVGGIDAYSRKVDSSVPRY